MSNFTDAIRAGMNEEIAATDNGLHGKFSDILLSVCSKTYSPWKFACPKCGHTTISTELCPDCYKCGTIMCKRAYELSRGEAGRFDATGHSRKPVDGLAQTT